MDMSRGEIRMNCRAFETMLGSVDLPHVAVAIVDRDGLRYAHASGVADAETGTAMRCDTILQIASLTKAIVSAAALKLVEDGLVQLHADVGDRLPALADPQVLTGFSADGKAATRPAKGPITLHHLLTHTAGFSYPFTRAETHRLMLAQGESADPLASITQPLLFDPGDRWEYGVSTDWVGQLIAAVTGGSLEAYLGEVLLGPLGMADTAFRAALPPDAAKVHTRLEDGRFQPVSLQLGSDFQSGGAGLTSTVLDFGRFITMILADGMFEGRRVLAPAIVEGLCRNQIGRTKAGVLRSVMPDLARRFDPFPGVDCEWTYGFLRLPAAQPSGMRAGTLSWVGLFNSYYWIDRASNLGGLFSTQLTPFGDKIARDTYGKFVETAYQ
jgi:methyl acetate hydrolase